VSALFRRGRGRPGDADDAEAAEQEVSELDDAAADEDLEDEEELPGLSPRPDGPWDVAERPDAEGLVDLGAIRLRGRDGMELRLEIEESSGMVTAATVQVEGSAVQLQAFAAPRSEGIWEEIRSEIAAGITRQGGTVDEVPGSFGRELIARIPVRTPDGRAGHQPARFVGVDGPRWFLRAVFHGPAVYDAQAGAAMESVVRDVVVVRGEEAMAPRDLLPLRLPDAVATQTEQQPEEQREPLEPFRRGPEITEIH
jgi:Protein of unknown function (DUF3710)